jgi:hypothetical protein
MRKTRKSMGRNAEFYVIHVTPASEKHAEFNNGEELTANQRQHFGTLLDDNYPALLQPVDSPHVSREWESKGMNTMSNTTRIH